MTPDEFMRAYEQRTNTHRFAEISPLIADNAVYWFNDGSFQGKEAIQQACEQTWRFIQDERYTIDHVQWLISSEQNAVCIYFFHWQGLVNGHSAQGNGRGTSVLTRSAGRWQVIHEHLSNLPA